MTDYVEKLCDIWGKHYAGGDNVHALNFPRRSTIHRMMTELAPTHFGNYRSQRNAIPLESSGATAMVLRDISPLRAKESRRTAAVSEPDNPIAEMIEAGLRFLNNDLYKEIADMRHRKRYDNETAAKSLSIGVTAYKKYVYGLYLGLDVYIRAQHPDMYRQIQALE